MLAELMRTSLACALQHRVTRDRPFREGSHTLVLFDFQSQMAFATHSIDAVTLRNNAALISHAACDAITVTRPGAAFGGHSLRS